MAANLVTALALVPLPPEDTDVVVVPMLTIPHSVDLYLGDLQRRGYSRRTLSTYRRILELFCDDQPAHYDVTDLRPDDCRRTLDRWNHRAQGTKAHVYTVLNAYLKWLVKQERIRRNPLDPVPQPRRVPAEDLDVTTITSNDVARLLGACQTWPETLTIAVLAYAGPRRAAAARLRLRDYDQLRGRLRFYEKGGKVIWKPVPHELGGLIRVAIADGAIPTPDSYLIPPEGTLVKPGDRDDRVLWRIVKRVAARAGIEAHAHALRAAFATGYLEQHPGDLEALQPLMGHRSLRTTQTYLRRLDREAAMERVRDLSWSQTAGKRFESSLVMGAGGFEPPFQDNPHPDTAGTQHLADELLERAREAAARAPTGAA